MLLSYIIICISHKSIFFLLNGSAKRLLYMGCSIHLIFIYYSNLGGANIAYTYIIIKLYTQVKLLYKCNCGIHHLLTYMYLIHSRMLKNSLSCKTVEIPC